MTVQASRKARQNPVLTDGATGGIEQVLRQLEEQQRRIGDVQKSLAAVQVTGHSADRLVSVTLDHAMKVAGIEIDSQAMRMTSYRLAESLQEALNAGTPSGSSTLPS
ncbi:YbaB/EbfC family nucleoid-associated protein [Dactylosporangium sp. NPDC049742]|uniref:YbaB/EbfC family nucleoid-associated protein n=1 Tax=Dactylosporangium sp. NPDC049742 TaxID=3154737 RepID=UPI003448828A